MVDALFDQMGCQSQNPHTLVRKQYRNKLSQIFFLFFLTKVLMRLFQYQDLNEVSGKNLQRRHLGGLGGPSRPPPQGKKRKKERKKKKEEEKRKKEKKERREL